MDNRIKIHESALLNDVFNDSGYVLGFTNETFADFIKRVLNVDPYSDEHLTKESSKGKKLRLIFDSYTSTNVVKLLEALLDCADSLTIEISRRNDVEAIITKYGGKSYKGKDEFSLSDLTNNSAYKKVENYIKDNLTKEPLLCLDRTHTLATHIMVNLCNETEIGVCKNRKEDTKPVGCLYEEFIESKKRILDRSMSESFIEQGLLHLLGKDFSNIRNKYSYAHANKIFLPSADAAYIVKSTMVALEYLVSKFALDNP